MGSGEPKTSSISAYPEARMGYFERQLFRKIHIKIECESENLGTKMMEIAMNSSYFIEFDVKTIFISAKCMFLENTENS